MLKMIRLIPMLLLSAAVALSISFIPHLLSNTSSNDFDQFTVAETMNLTSGNLVDQFSQLTFQHKLERIDWNGNLLQVDLNVGNVLSSEYAVYEDLFTLSRFCFSVATNVDTLLVRVLSGDERGSRWILGMNASKNSWDEFEAKKALKEKQDMKQYLLKHFQFTTSEVWKKLEAL